MIVPAVSNVAQRNQDFDTLRTSVASGNLPGAQQAFAALLQDIGKTGPAAGGDSLFASGSQASRDLSALGGALKSANLAGAQRAMSALQQDIQGSGQNPNVPVIPHHHQPLTRAAIANNGVEPAPSGLDGSVATSVDSILSSHL